MESDAEWFIREKMRGKVLWKVENVFHFLFMEGNFSL